MLTTCRVTGDNHISNENKNNKIGVNILLNRIFSIQIINNFIKIILKNN